MKIGTLVKLTSAGKEHTDARLLKMPCLVLRIVKPGDGSSRKDYYGNPNMLLWELLTCEGTCVYWPVGYTHTVSNERFFEVVLS